MIVEDSDDSAPQQNFEEEKHYMMRTIALESTSEVQDRSWLWC